MIKSICLPLVAVGAMGICYAPSVGQVAAQEKTHAATSDDLKKVLSWLPSDTETITVARGPFVLVSPSKQELTPQTWHPNRVVPDQQLAQDFEDIPFLLFDFANGLLSTRLQGKDVVLAVEGSRHFRAPAGLGLMPFEGCAIVVFADDLGNDARLFLRETRKAAVRLEEIQGQQVSVFQVKAEEDTWTTFVAFPNKNVVLVASNLDYLKEVLTRLQGGKGERALPSDLPEWKHVDTESRVWGLRHYDRSQAKTDPSSPFGGRKSANDPDEKAIGVTFAFDPSRGRSATVTYLSDDKSITAKANAGILTMSHAPEAKGLNIKFRELAPGVVEASYSLEQMEPIDFFLFALEGMLGHAVYL